MKALFVTPLPMVLGLMLTLTSFPARCAAQLDTDDRFDSDNKSTSVHPSVLDRKIVSFKKIPYKITRSEVKKIKPEPIKSDDFGELNRNQWRDAAVLGKVDSVYLTPDGKKLILNLGKDHRFCFKAVIDEPDFPKFGTNSAQRIGAVYRGKTVLVNGLLYQYQNLPQIAVTLPYQLEVVAGK
jgi:hypothetical protein